MLRFKEIHTKIYLTQNSPGLRFPWGQRLDCLCIWHSKKHVLVQAWDAEGCQLTFSFCILEFLEAFLWFAGGLHQVQYLFVFFFHEKVTLFKCVVIVWGFKEQTFWTFTKLNLLDMFQVWYFHRFSATDMSFPLNKIMMLHFYSLWWTSRCLNYSHKILKIIDILPTTHIVFY